jgi:hypothetical protein
MYDIELFTSEGGSHVTLPFIPREGEKVIFNQKVYEVKEVKYHILPENKQTITLVLHHLLDE